MTKAINSKKSHMAIILCIILILISSCSFVSVADSEGGNTQIFAARLCLVFAPPASATLSNGTGMRIVSWIRKQDANIENGSLLFEAETIYGFFADKSVSYRICKSADTYTGHKPVSYVLRI